MGPEKTTNPVKVPSSPIWNRFTPIQRQLWIDLFTAFRSRDNLSPGTEITDAQLDVIAHNCALEALWIIPAPVGRRARLRALIGKAAA